MNMSLRNALVAAVAAIAIGTLLGQLSDFVNAPDLGQAGWTIATAVGIILFFVLRMAGANRPTQRADAEARERALAFACPTDRALVYFVRKRNRRGRGRRRHPGRRPDRRADQESALHLRDRDAGKRIPWKRAWAKPAPVWPPRPPS